MNKFTIPRPVNCSHWQKPPEKDSLSMVTLKSYTDDNCLEHDLLKCSECGQLYFYQYFEETDWSNGGCCSHFSLIPVNDSDTAEELIKETPYELLSLPGIRWENNENPKWVFDGV